MGHSWIIAVLDDLRTYADLNDLPALAASIGDAARVARAEAAPAGGAARATLAAHGTGAPWERGDGVGPRTMARPAGRG